MTVQLDGTNLLVFGGVLLIVAAGAWQFIGAFLVWAFWQVVLYYVLLALVAVALYGALFLAVGGQDPVAGDGGERDRVDESPAE